MVFMLIGHLGGCSSIRVSQDYDPSRDFSSLQTYVWQREKQPETGDVRVDNSLLDTRFRSAIDNALAKKGFQKQSEGKPDFFVAYTYQIDSKIESSKVTFGFGFGSGGGGAYTGMGVNSGGRVNEYDEGLLVIDLMDAATGDLLWRGTGTARVDQHSKPEESVKDINEVVEKILAQFPPQAN
jgi:hypothetical protein